MLKGAWAMHAHAARVALGVGDGLLQALLDAFKCGEHDFYRPFQMLTSTSTKPASSLRPALVDQDWPMLQSVHWRPLRVQQFPDMSLNILRLLAHLLDQQLQVDGGAGDFDAAGLGTQRIGFAIHLLKEEIKPLADAACSRLAGAFGFGG